MTQEIISETAEDRVSQKPLTSWDNLPLVLTVEEAAKVVGVGCRAIYDLARTKRQGFPVVRLSLDSPEYWATPIDIEGM
ncbi:MAG: hypothetical protein KGZ50_04575 [Peptococcaceae bacterium]|nr:hypothetical protein [Peptococcaceae bacterium]